MLLFFPPFPPSYSSKRFVGTSSLTLTCCRRRSRAKPLLPEVLRYMQDNLEKFGEGYCYCILKLMISQSNSSSCNYFLLTTKLSTHIRSRRLRILDVPLVIVLQY